LHEFGHALGISRPGHSFNSADVMFGHNLATTWITLSDGDRSTLLELFPN
jgi:predicted Zn-dependent protease